MQPSRCLADRERYTKTMAGRNHGRVGSGHRVANPATKASGRDTRASSIMRVRSGSINNCRRDDPWSHGLYQILYYRDPL
jgi:hypothetical protein